MRMFDSCGSSTMAMAMSRSMFFKFSAIPSLALSSSGTQLPFPYCITSLCKFPNSIVLSRTVSSSRFQFHHLLLSTSQDPVPSSDNEPDFDSAQLALSKFLSQECGVSEDESAAIVSKAPKYVGSLVEGVRELEELSRWDQYYMKDDGVVGGFEGKVVFLAKQKGDNGKVAFLESLGLSLPSAIYVARLLSSESLPALIQKVKVMKEMFFSGRDELLGKKARTLMANLSTPVDEDIQQTLSLFQKIEAKRGGLNILGYEDASLRYLIESFPRVLLLSVEYHIKPLMEYLESVGVPHEQMRTVLLLFPPIMFCGVEDIKRKLLVFEEVAAADGGIGKLLLKYPWVISTSIQGNYKSIISFFEMEKVPRIFVHRAVKSLPHLLGCSTSKLAVMVKCFGELGVGNKKLGKVIATSPQLLLRIPEEFFRVVSLLEDVGFDQKTVGEVLVRCPNLFAASVEKTLKKKLEFLRGIGVSRAHFPQVIKKYPEVLLSDVDKTLRPRINYLEELGLSKAEIAFMVRCFSPLLGYSMDEVYRPKVEYLLKTMEKPLDEIVQYPRYFSYSLEKKIKPRHQVLRGRKIELSLKDMLGKSDEEFAAEFMDVGRMLVPPESVPPSEP